MASHPTSVRALAALLGNQLGAALLLLVASALAARTLAPAAQGQWSAAQAGFWLVVLVCGAGTPQSFAAAQARAAQAPACPMHRVRPLRVERRRALRLAAGLGGCATLVLAARGQGADGAAWALAAPAALLAQLLGQGLLARNNARAYRAVQLAGAGTTAALCLVGFARGWRGAVWWAPAAGQWACAAVAWHTWLPREGRAAGRATPAAAPPARGAAANDGPLAQAPSLVLVREGLPIMAAGVVQTLGLRGDLLVAGAFVPWADVAALALAKQLVERLGLIGQALAPLALARAARAPNDVREGIAIGWVTAGCSLAGAGALAAALPWLVPWLFGEGYLAAVPLALFLLPGAVAQNVASVAALDQTGRRRPWVGLVGAAVGLAAQGAALWASLGRWGVGGAAVASSVGGVGTLVGQASVAAARRWAKRSAARRGAAPPSRPCAARTS